MAIPAREMPTLLRPATTGGLPATMTKGGTSWLIRLMPPHAVAANLGELVHSRETADDGAVFDNDVTGQGRHVAHDDVVADNAVMGNMGIGHHQDIVADARFIAFPDSAMNRSTFADGHMVTNNGRRIFPFIFKVWGTSPMLAPWKNSQPFPMVVRPVMTTCG